MNGDSERLRKEADIARQHWEAELAKLNDMVAVDMETGNPSHELVAEQRKVVEAAQAAFDAAADAYLKAMHEESG